MQMLELPTIEYRSSGVADLKGKFVIDLTALGCEHQLGDL
jgi:hypothetical protein